MHVMGSVIVIVGLLIGAFGLIILIRGNRRP